jgi:subtilisin family serine protease
MMAGPLASALNGRGMVGVAYNATILEVRADVDGGYEGRCAFRRADLARGVDYATEQRARIIVLPLQAQNPFGAAFEAALTRAVDSGAVVVVAAGNRRQDQPSWPARYAADPRYTGSIIVTGATGYSGEITPWTNRPGATRSHYIAAPGEWILSDCKRLCALVSGTSFSATYVAGAIALMMEAHPELSGPEAAERVLSAARDAGAPGPDEVYGRGVLDLARAFPPE